MDPNDMHLAAYRRALRAKNRSPRTIGGYEYSITQLAARYPGTDVTELTSNQMKDYFAVLLAEQKSTSALHHYRQLRAFFNWAVREEIIDRSPMAGMEQPSVTDEPPPIVDDDDLRALLKACAGTDFEARRDTAIIRLWCEPGSPRVSEMAGIELVDLDMRHDQVTIRGKGDKVRVVPFGAKTGQSLDRYLRVRARHKDAKLSALWIGSRGMRTTASGLQQMLRRRCRQAGIDPLHPHQLRHTAAHQWFDNDGSEADADELFGWAPSSNMGRIYGRSAKQDRARRSARRKSLGDRL